MNLKEGWKNCKCKIGWIGFIIGSIAYYDGYFNDDMQLLIVSAFTVGLSFMYVLYTAIMDKLTAVTVEICSVQEFLERLGEIKDNSSDEQL